MIQETHFCLHYFYNLSPYTIKIGRIGPDFTVFDAFKANSARYLLVLYRLYPRFN
jgi:hypothetical protein